MNFLILFKVEWVKTMRMRSTFIAFVAVGLLTTIIQLSIYRWSDESDLIRRFKEFDFDTSLLVNGYQSTLITMIAAFMLLIVPMTIVTFARQVAGEDLRGTLRLILSRPVSRFALMNAKFGVCMAYALLLMGFFLTLSYGMGLVLFGPKSSITVANQSDLRFSQISPEYQTARNASRRSGGGRRFTFDWRGSEQGQMVRDAIYAELRKNVIGPWTSLGKLCIVWLLSSWSLFTLGALALLYSTLCKHPIAAMALTLGTFFGVFIIQGLASAENIIPLFQAIEPYLFTTAMDFWRESFAYSIDWSKVWSGTWLLGVYTLVFFALAQFIFWRKDITS